VACRREPLLIGISGRAHQFPICMPMISPDTINSTRRFFCRPSAVPLSASGEFLPNYARASHGQSRAAAVDWISG